MSAELINGNIRVCLDCIGEGWNGDFNEDDPNDEALLRFDVYVRNPEWFDSPYDEWHPLDDASYCTAFPESASQELQDKAVKFIMDKVEGILLDNYNEMWDAIKEGDYEDGGIKKLCERLSWIDPSWVSDNPDKNSLEWVNIP